MLLPQYYQLLSIWTEQCWSLRVRGRPWIQTGVSFWGSKGYVGLEALAPSILSIRRGAPPSASDRPFITLRQLHSLQQANNRATQEALRPLSTNPPCTSQRLLFSSLSSPLLLPSQWLKLKQLLKFLSELPRCSNAASDAHSIVINAIPMYVVSSVFTCCSELSQILVHFSQGRANWRILCWHFPHVSSRCGSYRLIARNC